MQFNRRQVRQRRLRIETLEPRRVLNGTVEPLALNIAPSFVVGPDPQVLEDAGPQSIADWATEISPGDETEAGQSLAFELTADRPELFSELPAIAADGTLSFQAAADAHGVAMVGVRLFDDGGGDDSSAVQTFTITITPVNDQPTFHASNPPAVDEDSGAHTVKFWALFEPGAANELNQRGPVYEVVRVSRPEMFDVLPKVSKTLGTLTYTLKADAFGDVDLDVIVRDSGGEADGGVNTSAIQTFTLTVNGVNDPPQANSDWFPLTEDSRDNILDVLANDSIIPDIDETLTITDVYDVKHGRAEIVDGGTRIRYTPHPNFVGSETFHYRISDGNGGVDSAAITVNVANRSDEIAVLSAGAGAEPEVVVFDAATGQQKNRFAAYHEKFRGGVRVATGDVNGDGTPDIITGAGPGGGPHVRVFDGATGQPIDSPVQSFMAFDIGFAGGVYVASADVDGDGLDDVIVGADAGGGPHVRVFSAADGRDLMSFFAYSANFTGGVRVAAADLNSDGFADLITGAGPGGGPHVRAIDGKTGGSLRDFYAYNPAFTGGVFVATGDVDDGGLADIITGAGAGGGPHVRAFGGFDNKTKADFFAYEASYLGGVPVAATDVDGDYGAEILVGHGPRSDGQARVFKASGALVDETDAFAGFDGAAYVAGSSFTFRGPGSSTDTGSVSTNYPGHGPGGITITIGTVDVPFVIVTHPVIPITDADVDSLREGVIARWVTAGLDPGIARLFHFVEVHLEDLSGSNLGSVDHQDNSIVLDTNGGSYGWFVDPTPLDDQEFAAATNGELAATDDDAIPHVDLVTALSHYFGELLGVDPIPGGSSGDLMESTLPTGVRRLVNADHVDAIFADSE